MNFPRHFCNVFYLYDATIKMKKEIQAEEKRQENPGRSHQMANGIELGLVIINWLESFWPRACYTGGEKSTGGSVYLF